MLLLTTFLLQYIDFLTTTSTNKQKPIYDIKSYRILYKQENKNENNNLQKIIDELKKIDNLLHR